MRDTKNTYKFLIGRLEGKRPLVRTRCGWEDNNEVDLKQIGCEVVDWLHLAQDRTSWGGGTFVSTIIDLRVP
jgi:hypothetical protein